MRIPSSCAWGTARNANSCPGCLKVPSQSFLHLTTFAFQSVMFYEMSSIKKDHIIPNFSSFCIVFKALNVFLETKQVLLITSWAFRAYSTHTITGTTTIDLQYKLPSESWPWFCTLQHIPPPLWRQLSLRHSEWHEKHFAACQPDSCNIDCELSGCACQGPRVLTA